jgi:hypothetical protein
MTEQDLDSAVRQLSEHLAATGERPVERTASRWIGEADAIAGDLVGSDASTLDPTVIHRRVSHVAELLSNVDDTGDSTANEHVDAARDLADLILENTEG